MPLGPGKYDEVCTLVREETKAEGVILIIFGGEHGNGFSMQSSARIILNTSDILRSVADQIDQSSARA